MKTEKMLASFCGDYCGKCPNYPRECHGCAPSEHMDCHFVKCCLSKNIEHCGFCADFPCVKLSNFVPDDRPECPKGYHVENLRTRKTIGTELWLQTQRSKWKSWHCSDSFASSITRQSELIGQLLNLRLEFWPFEALAEVRYRSFFPLDPI